MLVFRTQIIQIIAGIFVSGCCNAENIYGIVDKSEYGYYFHTEKNIDDDVLLKLIPSNIVVHLKIPITSREPGESDPFYFHSTYAYKIEDQETQKLDSLRIFSYPAIVLNKKNVAKFDSTSFVSSSCFTSEGIHHSIWEKNENDFIRAWSIYAYIGYEIEPNCYDWELAG